MWSTPTQKRLDKIPRLNEQAEISAKDQMVHLHFFIGGSGLVILCAGDYAFINFHTGHTYIRGLSTKTTKTELNNSLKHLPLKNLHNCYTGSISGPRRMKSWRTK